MHYAFYTYVLTYYIKSVSLKSVDLVVMDESAEHEPHCSLTRVLKVICSVNEKPVS